MSTSHQYILHLIRSVQAKPCIWEYYSEFYFDKEYVANSWELVTLEVRKYAETDEITVSNVKQTWKYLLRSYDTCLLDVNPSNFEFFREMEFLGDNGAWYYKLQKYTHDKDSAEGTMLLLHFRINIFALGLFICLLFYDALTQPTIEPRKTDLWTIMLVIFIYAILGFLPCYEGCCTEYYSRSSVPLIRNLVTVSVISFILEKIFLLKLSNVHLPNLAHAICLLLGLASILVIIMTNAGYSCKVWTNFVCFILRTTEASSIFYVIPIWVVLNALWSYFFCYYLWMNVDFIFPNFNENKFVMTPRPNTPYHIEFKQKPRKPIQEVE